MDCIGHFKMVCSVCKKVVAQCRCMSTNKKEISGTPCKECYDRLTDSIDKSLLSGKKKECK